MKTVSRFFLYLLGLSGIYRTVLDVGSDEIRLFRTFRFFGLVKMTALKKLKISNRNAAGAVSAILKGEPAFGLSLSFSGMNVIPVFFSLPKMSAERLRSVLGAEIGKRIPLNLNEVRYQYRVLSTLRTEGMEKMNILAICIRREEYEKVLGALKDSGVLPESAVYLPMQALHSIREKLYGGRAGAAVISSHSVYLTVLDGGVPKSFSVFNGSFRKINAITVKNIVRYFQESAKTTGVRLERICLIPGNGVELPVSLPETLSESLGCRVETASRKDYIFRLKNGQSPEACSDLFGHVRKPVSPFAPDFLESPFSVPVRSAIRAATAIVLLMDLAALAAIPLETGALLRQAQIRRLQSNPPAPNAGPETLELYGRILQAKKLDGYLAEINALNGKISEARKSGAEQSKWAECIAEISRLIPPDTKLTGLTVNSPAGEMSGVAGSSDSLDRFIRGLASSRLFKSVSLKKTELSRDFPEGAVEFLLTFEAAL